MKYSGWAVDWTKPSDRSWPRYSMTDPNIVDQYVNQLYQFWISQRMDERFQALIWPAKLDIYVSKNIGGAYLQNLQEAQNIFLVSFRELYMLIANKVFECLRNTFNICGIPIPKMEMSNIVGSAYGAFFPSKWLLSLRTSESIFNQRDIWLDNWRILFAGIAETVYHEGRHTEQYWLLTCQWVSENRGYWNTLNSDDPISKHQFLKLTHGEIPSWVIDKAYKQDRHNCNSRSDAECVRKGDSAFGKMVKQWFDDNYDLFRSRVKFQKKNTTGLSPEDIAFQDWCNHRDYKYSSLEYDAFRTQGLVREALCKFPEFKSAGIYTLKIISSRATEYLDRLNPGIRPIKRGRSSESPF